MRASPSTSSDVFGPTASGAAVDEHLAARRRSRCARRTRPGRPPAASRRHRVGQVGARREQPGDLVAGVDERERPDPGELLAQRRGQHQREVREAGDRAADVAEHHQLGLVRPARAVVGRQRHAAGGQRGAHGPPDVQPALPAEPAAGRQPGRQPPGQRVHRRGAARPARSRCARRKSTWSASGGTAERATWSRSRSSAIRRRTSASTYCAERGDALLQRSAGRPARPGRHACSPASSASSIRGDQRLRRQRAQHPVGEPGLPAAAGLPARPSSATASRANRRSASSSPSSSSSAQLVAQRVQVGLARLAGARRPRRRGARQRRTRVAHRRRPPQVEEQVERRPVRRPLEQRGGQRRPQLLRGRAGRSRRAPASASRPRSVPTGTPGLAQRADEARRACPAGCHDGQLSFSSVAAPGAASAGVLEHDAERGPDGVRRRGCRGRARAGCGPSRSSRRSTAPSSAPAPRSTRTVRTSASASCSAELRHPRKHDAPLPVGVGVVEVQVEAAALERLRQLAGRVGGEHDERPAHAPTTVPSSGMVTWKSESTSSSSPSTSTSALSISSTSSTVGSVRRIAVSSGRGSRNSSVKMSSRVASHVSPAPVACGIRSSCLRVVPLVQRAGLVDALVALQPDQPGVRRRRDRLGQLGLADPGRALDEQRLAEAVGEEDRRRRPRRRRYPTPASRSRDIGRRSRTVGSARLPSSLTGSDRGEVAERERSDTNGPDKCGEAAGISSVRRWCRCGPSASGRSHCCGGTGGGSGA